MFNGDGKIPSSGSNLPVGNEALKFHEYILYGVGVMSRTLRKHYTTWILGKGVNLKTELISCLSSLFATHRLDMI